MHFLNILTSLASILSFSEFAAATLRITAGHHSFGGVNYPGLQFLQPAKRDEVIQAIVKSGARVIRLFIRGDKNDNFDPETWIGGFNHAILDQFDDTLAAINRISKGQVKVIIAPHDAHALRGSNDVPCDAYCEKLGGAFLDFYSDPDFRKAYKDRLGHIFRGYTSKNFNGARWNTLNHTILGVDLQNEPWSGIFPIVAGEGWLCDIATHMRDALKFTENGIAIITGGLSGAQQPGGKQNFPDSALECDAIDVISVHGYYSAGGDHTSGTNWANMFVPGNTLISRAEKEKKLILVEEMSYIKSEFGLNYKKQDIWDQGNALNYRGIPWIYSKLTIGGEGTSPDVNVLREDQYAIGALKDVLKRASSSRSNFDWSRFLAPSAPLSNLTHVAMNPYTLEQGHCTFGCPGWLCDSPDGCSPDLICKNSVCQEPTEQTLGFVGAECDNHKKRCHETLKCIDGTCEECVARTSVPSPDIRKPTIAGSISGSCELDNPFTMRPYCVLSPSNLRANPCLKAADCDADQFCDWGTCKLCEGEGCLGTACKSSRTCKTGFCNNYGRCDYPGKAKKPMRPEDFMGRRGPAWGNQGAQKGPSKPMDNVVKVNVPKEEVVKTGGVAEGPKATATATATAS